MKAPAIAVATLATTALGFNPTLEEHMETQCLLQKCYNEVTVYNKSHPVRVPCSVASGALPLQLPPTLPLYFQGNYDLCTSFKEAHYCTIRTGPIPIPPPLHTTVGDFRLNQCVAKTCSEELLRSSFIRQIHNFSLWVEHLPGMNGTGPEIEKLISSSLIVDCMEEQEDLDVVGSIIIMIFFGSLFLVFLATALHAWFPHYRGPRPLLVDLYSAKKNFGRLVAEVPGDFGAFNGIRVLSMFWIICGHTLLQFVDPPMTNSTELQRFLQSYWFSLFRGAEYAVDTFFFMSGFLATFGTLKQFKGKGLSVAKYGTMVFSRYLRLTPAYAFVLLWFWKVIPTTSDGPFWRDRNRSTSSANVEPCTDYWWTNMLYVNNLVPFGSKESCASWTWYLANDFQFFLMAPLLCAVYIAASKQFRTTRVALVKMFGPCIFLIMVQILSSIYTMEHFKLNGSMSPFTPSGSLWWGHMYITPWTRMTPYVVGVLFGLVHDYRVSTVGDLEWKSWVQKSPLLAGSLFFGGLGVMFGLVSTHYFQWKCYDTKENCDAWMGYIYNGFFVMQNWGQAEATYFYSSAFLVWSLALGSVCYTLFSGYATFVNDFLSHPIFTPLARLTYVAYLFHIPVQALVHFSQPVLPFFARYNVLMEVIGYIVMAYSLSFIVYFTIEKPFMSMTSMLLLRMQPKPSFRVSVPRFGSDREVHLLRDDTRRTPTGFSASRHQQDLLDQHLSAVNDVDSESVVMASPLNDLGDEESAATYEHLLPPDISEEDLVEA